MSYSPCPLGLWASWTVGVRWAGAARRGETRRRRGGRAAETPHFPAAAVFKFWSSGILGGAIEHAIPHLGYVT